MILVIVIRQNQNSTESGQVSEQAIQLCVRIRVIVLPNYCARRCVRVHIHSLMRLLLLLLLFCECSWEQSSSSSLNVCNPLRVQIWCVCEGEWVVLVIAKLGYDVIYTASLRLLYYPPPSALCESFCVSVNGVGGWLLFDWLVVGGAGCCCNHQLIQPLIPDRPPGGFIHFCRGDCSARKNHSKL